MSEIIIGHRLIGDPAMPRDQHLGKKIGFETDLLLASRLLITADSGGGKSWLARVLFEQTFGKVQQIIIDPEGEFASLREKFPFVLVGKGGDTPADVRSAAMLAHRLLKLRVSAICDLYELKPADRQAWAKSFFEALIEAPKELRTPLVLSVDEFQMFAPESGFGVSVALDASIDVATRGRKRGICLAGITQRLAQLNKNVTSQMQNRLIGAQFEEVNVVTAAKLFGIPPGAPMREFRENMQLLEPGQFYAFGRAISRERILIKVGDVQTSHPKAFEKHTTPPPPTPEKVKKLLPQLADLPKEAEQKAKTEAEYRSQVRQLTADLESTRGELARAQNVKPIAAPPRLQRQIDTQVYRAQKDRDVQWNAAVRLYQRDLVEKLSELSAAQVKAIREIVPFHFVTPNFVPPISQANAPEPIALAPPPPAPKLPPPAVRVPMRKVPDVADLDSPEGAAPLGSVAKQIAGILSAYWPEPIKRSILAAMCGLVDGGNFSGRLSELRSNGLLEDPARGLLKATEKCRDLYFDTFQPPKTTEEVIALWQGKLGELAIQIVRKLVEADGEPVRRAELAAALGLVDGGNFSGRLSEVRSTGLMLDVGRGLVAANCEALFLKNHQAASA